MGHERVALWMLVSVVGCGGAQEEPKTAINPVSVPSLALLGTGAGERSNDATGSGTGRSCEEVSNEARRKAEASGDTMEEPPESHLQEIRAVLDDGSYLNDCDVPSSAALELCVAIVDGRAAGVTVDMTPGDEPAADCVADAIRELEFPTHQLVSVARTQFH